MKNRRVFFKQSSLISAGIVLGCGGRTALAESARELVVHNDYDTSIEIDIFHPNSLAKTMATWVIPSSVRTRLNTVRSCCESKPNGEFEFASETALDPT